MNDPLQALRRYHPDTAWGAFFPTAGNRWDEVKAAHLFRRAAAGANWSEIQEALQHGLEPTLARLLSGRPGLDRFEAEVLRLEQGALESDDPQQLKAAWLYRMMYSPHPLLERMTLFWHNHFATSNAKVANLRLMHAQIATLRRHALGHFDDMLQAMTRDPAMIIWLDGEDNVAGKPNENYAREVMELFSLGIGNYTEKDIQEAARALTGWRVRDGAAQFDPEQHDAGVKRLLGREGRFGAGDVVRICLAQEACAVFLVRKLFRFLIAETYVPPDEYVNPLAAGFRQRNYDISWLVGRMLSSWVFFSPAAIGQKIKSPVDFAVGTVKALEGRVGTLRMAEVCDRIGQSLYYPPSVKGWDGGEGWINSTTLLNRQNLAFEMTRGTDAAAGLDPARLCEKYGIQGEEATAEFFLRLFHQSVDPAARDMMIAYLAETRREQSRGLHSARSLQAALARGAAHLALTLPEYQIG